MHFLSFYTIKTLTLQMDHAKLLDVLTSFPVSHAILPRAVCFATSRLANHAICSFIDSSGYASGPIRICLFIDHIISTNKSLIKQTILSVIFLQMFCILFFDTCQCDNSIEIPNI